MTRCAQVLCFAFMLIYPSVSFGAQLTAPPAFEVASIRPHTGPLHAMMELRISGTLIRMEGYDYGQLVMEAYGAKPYQVSLPRELSNEGYYDLAMRAPGDGVPSQEKVREMLQTLLADRFKLVIHHKMKVMPVYALVAGKNGPKLKESAPGNECFIPPMGPPTPESRVYVYKSKGCPISDLVNFFTTLIVERPVVDRTGMAGKYDISLEATPNFMLRSRSDPDDISVFTAVKSLGLKLEPQRAAMQMIVVDHIEKPSEN